MNVVFDGVQLDIPEKLTTRESLWYFFEEQAEKKGRVLVDVLSDGESLSYADFLTVPEEIEVEVFTATPYGLAMEVLALLAGETQALVASSKEGSLTTYEVSETFEFAIAAIMRMREAYPEWITADRLGELALEIKECANDGGEGLSAKLDDWCATLAQGIDEMETYRQADEEVQE